MTAEIEKRFEALESEIYYLRKQRKIQFILIMALICIVPVFSASIMNGDFGVGLTSPTARMHVLNTGSSHSFRVDDAVSDASPFVVDNSGNIGIGTATPPVKLHMSSGQAVFGGYNGALTSPVTVNAPTSDDVFRGRINGTTTFLMRNNGSFSMGPISQYYATSSREDLRIIRGRVDAGGTINSGSHFTVNHTGTGHYTIAYSTAFSSSPSVTVSAQVGNPEFDCNLFSASNASQAVVRCWNNANAADMGFNFIAIGVRN